MNNLITTNLPNMLKGTIKTTTNGTGLIESSSGPAFLSFADSKLVMAGDEVLYSTVTQGDKQVVNFVKVTARRPSLLLGTVLYKNGNWVLQPDEICLIPIFIKQLDYCPEGTVVAARIDPSYKGSRAHASIERVLGPRQDSPEFINEYYLAKFDFATRFSFEPLQQLKKNALNDNHSRTRITETHLPYVTIDDESTSDMDDALFAEKADHGFNLFVAISDVSNYVTQGSDLDKAAYRNATSVYLPSKLTPMLPHELSSEVCSLVPNASRLAVTCKMELDFQGNVITTKFYRTTISSRAKLSYSQVTSFLDNPNEEMSQEVSANLKCLAEVYGLLSNLRVKNGYFEIEDEDVSIYFENNVPKAKVKARSISHKMVEECMLLTNIQAALKLAEKNSKGIYRHQPFPAAQDLQELAQWLTDHMGVSVDPQSLNLPSLVRIHSNLSPTEQNEFMVKVKNLMSPATYSTTGTSHFSLGFDAYCHFTSPIRRYADLLAHRLILGEDIKDLDTKVGQCAEKAKHSRMAEKGVTDFWLKTILGNTMTLNDKIQAQVINQSAKSLKALISNSRIFIYVGDTALKSGGFIWDGTSWAHPAKGAVRQGQILDLYYKSIGSNKSAKIVNVLTVPIENITEEIPQ